MKHLGTVKMETPRLILRPFVRSDAEAAYRNWCSDDEVTKFLRWPSHSSVAVTQMVLDDWIAQYEKPVFYQWAIVPKELGEPIGTISVVEMDNRVDLVHIGYCIGRKWWGQGITTEAFQRLIPFFFEEMGVNRVESCHDPNNPGSGAVMRKCGLHFEAVLRQRDFSNQGIVDMAMYALLREEYLKGKEK